MKMEDVLDEIKFELTGGLLELEIEDTTIIRAVQKVLRELARYYDETKLITVPFASCIDISTFNSSTIVDVYRTQGYGDTGTSQADQLIDPVYAQQWMIFSNGGTMYNLQDYVLNYAAWSTMGQIQNTLSTDLDFEEDKDAGKLYINNRLNTSARITIKYIPKLQSVEDIKDDYWIDILMRMSIAQTKVELGRIRTRFTLSNTPWPMDGEKLLEEGNTELKELREILRVHTNQTFCLD